MSTQASVDLEQIERQFAHGISSADILRLCEENGLKFSEATLRKYVQLGLLPRSVRVGRKGKHTGSQGVYPATIVRQILVIKKLLAQNLTIEEIQTQVLFVRGEIDDLERKLSSVFKRLREVARREPSEPTRKSLSTDIGAAEQSAAELVDKLVRLEQRFVNKNSSPGLDRTGTA